jgi:hypothetical protein
MADSKSRVNKNADIKTTTTIAVARSESPFFFRRLATNKFPNRFSAVHTGQRLHQATSEAQPYSLSAFVRSCDVITEIEYCQ